MPVYHFRFSRKIKQEKISNVVTLQIDCIPGVHITTMIRYFASKLLAMEKCMVFPIIKIELALEGIRGIRNSASSQRMRSIQYDKSAFFGMSDLAYRFYLNEQMR